MDTLRKVQGKIQSLENVKRLTHIWKFQGQRIVFTNGCFDLLHLGHVHYLTQAADLGDKFIIGLNTDESIAQVKGPKRPINNELSRSHNLASLFFVDVVVFFNEPTPLALIKAIQPDVLVKGADYALNEIIGAEVVTANRGMVTTIEYLQGYSTTAIEKKIKNA